MTPSNDVFALVKSLTRTEKRFFKVYSGRHVIGTENNYLRLFDALNAMDVYDEAAVKRKFQGEKFAERLSTEKVHLYNLILKAMAAYRSDKSPRRTITDLVNNAEFLTLRGLYSQSAKILRKARKLARKNDEFALELRIINLERINLKKSKTQSDEKFQQLIEDSRTVMDQLQRLNEARNFYDSLFAMQRRGERDTGSLKHFEEQALREHPLFTRPEIELTFTEKYYRFLILSNWYKMKGHSKAALENSHKLVMLLEGNPYRLQETPVRYAVVLFNYLTMCLQAGEYALYDAARSAIDSVQVQSREEQAEIIQMKYQMELVRCLSSGAIEQGISMVASLEADLDDYAAIINSSRVLSIYYNVSLLYLLNGNYKNALRWLNKIVKSTRTDSRRDIQAFARILRIVVLFEAGQQDEIAKSIAESQRFLQKAGMNTPFEKMMVKTFAKLDQVKSREALTEYCQNALDSLDALEESGKLGNSLGVKELRLWFSSKITGTSLLELYQENVVVEGNI